MRPRRALFINAHSCRNAGDAALLQTAIEQIRHICEIDDITVSLDDPDYYSGTEHPVGSLFTWIKQDGHWHIDRLLYLPIAALVSALTYRYFGRALFLPMPPHWQETIQAYLQAEVVFTKPGGFLYSSGRGLSLFIAVYSMLLAPVAGKPLYILPQSIGPLRYQWERLLIRLIFNKARMGFIREPLSQLELEKCGLKSEKYRLVPDMAFVFPCAARDKAKEWLREHENIEIDSQEKPLMGVTLINWGEQNRNFRFQQQYEDACADSISLFLKRWGGSIFFFPQVIGPSASQDDRIVARRILRRLPDTSRCILLENQPPPAILKALYGFMDIFIATRLHSAIFAWSQGIPTIAISYQPKTIGVARMLGLEDWVIKIEDVTSNLLSETLANLWEMREKIKEHLQQVIPSLVRQVYLMKELIAQDLEGLPNALKNKSG